MKPSNSTNNTCRVIRSKEMDDIPNMAFIASVFYVCKWSITCLQSEKIFNYNITVQKTQGESIELNLITVKPF